MKRSPAGNQARQKAAQIFAVFAMLLQVAFFADHLGASLAAEVGRAAPGARLGLLQICTGEGVAWITPDGQRVAEPGATPGPAQGHAGTSCPVCASASVCSFAAPQAAQLPVFVADLVAQPALVLHDRAPHAARRARVTQIRAPPRA
ncbi:MAG: DUF2946 family protein [Paenirhodobacter sp.]|uniref:DUF2946 family protein n=1 Tax=Paenirhodobacter sp. TaxID=1965326 RepID=UPI003D104DF6